MKTMMRTVLALTLMLMTGLTAVAQLAHAVPPGTNDAIQFTSGNQLLAYCQSDKIADKNYCLAYVISVVDMIGALQAARGRDGKSFWKASPICFPNNMDARQVTDIVVKYLTDHPETRNGPAANLAIKALAAVWGCPAPETK